MAKKSKPLERHKSGKEFLERARRSENYAGERVSGSHYNVYSKQGGFVTIPVHGNQDLAKGTRASIIKRMIAIGLALLTLVAVLLVIFGGVL